MPEITESTACTNPDCLGSGYVNDELCPTCFGQGSIPLIGLLSHIAKKSKELKDVFAVFDEKIDAIQSEQASQRANLTEALTNIIAEQASQREDLTVALTQIWNKVKDL